ncbi:unnamed protein product, partial [Prorocentrum cordatum]
AADVDLGALRRLQFIAAECPANRERWGPERAARIAAAIRAEPLDWFLALSEEAKDHRSSPTRRVPLRRRELPPRRSHGAGPGPHGVAQPRRPRAAGLPRAPRRLSGFRGCAEAAVRRLRGGPRADGVRAQGHRRGRGGGAPQLVRVRGPPGGRVLGGGEAPGRPHRFPADLALRWRPPRLAPRRRGRPEGSPEGEDGATEEDGLRGPGEAAPGRRHIEAA